VRWRLGGREACGVVRWGVLGALCVGEAGMLEWWLGGVEPGGCGKAGVVLFSG
jgi:hypothetical protein